MTEFETDIVTATQPAVSADTVLGASRGFARAGDFLALTKPRLTMLSVLTAVAAFYMGQKHGQETIGFVHLILATFLVGGGCGALNMYAEREQDSIMKRTAHRPIPRGRVSPREALIFGLILSSAGTVYMTFAANMIAGVLSALTVASYVLWYTPMKRRSPLNTLAGALPGALPPAIGWVAATGKLGVEAWVLFGILFLWQMPHFLSFSWMYRNDYLRAGYKMLSGEDETGRRTGRQILGYTLGLVGVSLLPAYVGLAGQVYLYIALGLGLIFVAYAVILTGRRRNSDARGLFFYSLIYLPILLLAMALGRS